MAEAIISSIGQSLISIRNQKERRTGIPFRSTLMKLSDTLEMLQAMAGDVATKHRTDNQVKIWLRDVKLICYDVEDVLDKYWSTVVLKRQIEEEDDDTADNGEAGDTVLTQKLQLIVEGLTLLCPCLGGDEIRQRHSYARDLTALRERLEDVSHDAYRFHFSIGSQRVDEKDPFRRLTTSFIDNRVVVGRMREKVDLLDMLLDLDETESSGTPNLQIISIAGMGGIGKTTLAKLCYNNGAVRSHFERRIWVSVSQDFDERYIAKAILESQVLEKLQDVSPDSLELATLLELVTAYIQHKKFLLVLDDVWEQDHRKWQNLIAVLQSGSRGSRILATMRNQSVAMALDSKHIFRLEGLDMIDSWAIFTRVAFEGFNGGELQLLEDIGKQIVERCGGVPLALLALGGILRTKRSRREWLKVLHSEIWKLDFIAPLLLSSYFDMPPAMRVCFSYCATFPKGFQIDSQKLIRLWMAQGYINEESNEDPEAAGEEYINDLIMRSLLEVSDAKEEGRGRNVEMHNLGYDLARLCSQGECLSVELNDNDLPSEARHLTITLSEEWHLRELQDFTTRHNKLRSLLLQSKRSFKGIEMQVQLFNLFTQMTLLRSLDLTGCAFGVLPPTIRNLVLLRVLILSMNEDLEELPEEICELCNLQTLEVNWCVRLKELPKGIGKLVRLRHLGNVLGSMRFVCLPRGIGRLTALRTLHEFNIGCNYGSASLADIKDLNQLGGCLSINGLGNVTNVGEAWEARLGRKTSITSLELNFQREEDSDRRPIDEELIEALQPHMNLEELTIGEYQGSRLPSWLSKLSNLRKISLMGCENCETLLDTLPQITSLERVNIYNSCLSTGLLKRRKVGRDWLLMTPAQRVGNVVHSITKTKS